MNTNRLANLRDVGGLPTRGGGVTRSGVLLRSDAPRDGDVDPEAVSWPPVLVVDLRSGAEAEKWGYSWPESTRVLRKPLHDRAAPDVILEDMTLDVVYDQILDRASPKIAALLGDIAEAPGPVLVHCAAGKDRTGVLVAVLLLVVGVEPEAIVSDYLATGEAKEAMAARWRAIGGGVAVDRLPPSLLETPESAIRLVLERVGAWPGGPRQWWIDHGASGEDLDRWAAKLVDLQ